jgi:MoxR-like ATPase
MDIERLDAAEYLPRAKPDYVDTSELLAFYKRIAFKANLILVGPKGVGKSLSVAAFTAAEAIHTVTFDCSEDVRRSHLIGAFTLRGNDTPFILGPLTTAFEIANEKGACVLVLEEINGLTPQIQKVLNPATDFRRRIEVPEAKRVFHLKENAKLWIVGTMNTSAYGGVYQLNEDLKSRFRMIPIDYPSEKHERAIIDDFCRIHSIAKDAEVVKKVLTLAKETRQGTYDYALSTRDVVNLLEDWQNVGINKALWMVTGKFEGDERDSILQRIKSIFGLAETVLK